MEVIAVSISTKKGVKKENVPSVRLVVGHGVQGDAHAGDWHRQVSLLGIESIEKMKALGANVGPGDFAENITISGLDLLSLPLGAKIRIGEAAVLELTQIGKECHKGCAIMKQVGDCIMPREGVFFIVCEEGEVKAGDRIEFLQ